MQLYTRREWLIISVMSEGVPWYLALEAVSSTALEHPEWDMNELVNELGEPSADDVGRADSGPDVPGSGAVDRMDAVGQEWPMGERHDA